MSYVKSMGLRDEAKARSRQALIDAGIELIGELGLDGPSLDAICERAGYTRGAFYVHFRDRDDFLFAVMQQVGRPLLDALLIGEDGEEADFETTVARFIGAFVDGSYPLSPAGSVRPHQLLQACARSEKIGRLYVSLVGESITRLAGKLERAQGAKLLRDDVSPTDLASTLLALIIGVQTMLDLGAAVDIQATIIAVKTLLQPMSMDQ